MLNSVLGASGENRVTLWQPCKCCPIAYSCSSAVPFAGPFQAWAGPTSVQFQTRQTQRSCEAKRAAHCSHSTAQNTRPACQRVRIAIQLACASCCARVASAVSQQYVKDVNKKKMKQIFATEKQKNQTPNTQLQCNASKAPGRNMAGFHETCKHGNTKNNNNNNNNTNKNTLK